MDNLIVRQPIFDKHIDVFGYEIVSRSMTANPYCSDDDGKASLSAIRNVFLLLGTKTTIGRKKLFLGFPRALIIDRVAHALPGNMIVIDVAQDVDIDDEVILACKELKEAGFSLALNEAAERNGSHPDLLPLADIIKGTFKSFGDGNDKEALQRYINLGKTVLAEEVETREDFDAACAQGYHLFQGSFFSKPSTIRSREIPGYELNYLQIAREVNQRELNYSELEKVIKRDTSLCYTLLNYINSAYFGLDESISSVRHALVLLGEEEVRKWANLILFTFLGIGKPSELMVTSLIRAKLCEAIGQEIGMKDRASELFLMGMFSMLDAMIGRPMADILKAIHLSKEVEEALLRGSNGIYGKVFEAVVNYEMGNSDDFSRCARELGINGTMIPDLYLQAVEWAETLSDIRRTSDIAQA